MKKELFKLIVAEFQKLGINPTQWLGTRTNVKRINKKNLAESSINEYAFNRELESVGKDRLLKLFNEEAKYLGQLNDSQATTLLQNLKTANIESLKLRNDELGLLSNSLDDMTLELQKRVSHAENFSAAAGTNVEIEIFESAGHMVHMEKAYEVNRCLLDFLN